MTDINDELVEKIFSIGVKAVLRLDKPTELSISDIYTRAKTEIRTLLQSRPPDEDTAKWMDRVHELEVELAKVRENVGTEGELRWLDIDIELRECELLKQSEVSKINGLLVSPHPKRVMEKNLNIQKSIRKKLSPESEGGGK